MAFYSEIVGAGSGFPRKVMTNRDFEKFIETSDEWIRTRTGISTRRIADPEKKETTFTFALEASQKALEMAKIKGEDIELIIMGTVTPVSLMPTTANFIQKSLGAKKAFSFDLQSACSGFIYALSIADQYIKTGAVKNALVIGGETLSSITDWKDRGTCILFGDGAGACVLQRSETEKHAILGTKLYSDGSKNEILYLDKKSEGTFIRMQGQEVFKLACRGMIDSSMEVLKECHLTPKDVDFFLFHQANIRIIEMCMKSMGISHEKTWLNVDKYGNTSAATLPVCLDEAWHAGKIKKGDLVLMTTFGGGVTWGAGLVRL